MSQFGNMPPNFGEPDLLGEARSWPKVIGIISIVWASLGLLCNSCTALSAVLTPVFMNMAPPQMQQQMQQQMASQNTLFNIVTGLLGVAMSVVLMYAGIQTMRYRWKGRMLHLVWAGLSVVLGIGGSIFGYGVMKQQVAAQLAQMQNDPNMAKMQPMIETMAYATFGCVVLFSLAYPLFILVWFGLIKKRPEDMGPPPQELVA